MTFQMQAAPTPKAPAAARPQARPPNRGGKLRSLYRFSGRAVLAVSSFMSKLPDALRGQCTGLRVTAEFEKAAVEVARMNGAKSVTINVGIIINAGWKKLLEARGYVHVLEEGAWIKTIKL